MFFLFLPFRSPNFQVWRNMLGVHGRREFNAMAEQWQPGDIIQVGIMCPYGVLDNLFFEGADLHKLFTILRNCVRLLWSLWIWGFSLIPYDLDGPDEMRFETETLEGDFPFWTDWWNEQFWTLFVSRVSPWVRPLQDIFGWAYETVCIQMDSAPGRLCQKMPRAGPLQLLRIFALGDLDAENM